VYNLHYFYPELKRQKIHPKRGC